MIEFEKISKFNIEEKIKSLPKDYFNINSFFSSYQMLDTILNHCDKNIYIVCNEKERYLLVSKEVQREYRFLFKKPSDNFLSEFIQEKEPRYVAVNCSADELLGETKAKEEEIVLHVDKILNQENKDFRKQYTRSIKHNPEFLITNYSYETDTLDIFEFLEEWRYSRTERLNFFAHIENDINFLLAYGNHPDTKGVVIRDGKKVVAYNIFVPRTSNSCFSCYSKTLRGYENLGVLLTVEKCKAMKKNGYENVYIGSINNDFKKSLRWASEIMTTYACELYKLPTVVFRDPILYLNRII